MNTARDSVIKEREFEQTAIASGEQLYRRSRDAEQKAQEEAAEYRKYLLYALIVALLIILLLSLYFNARQRAANRDVLRKDAKILETHDSLNDMERQKGEMQEELDQMKKEIASTAAELEKNKAALRKTKRKMQDIIGSTVVEKADDEMAKKVMEILIGAKTTGVVFIKKEEWPMITAYTELKYPGFQKRVMTQIKNLPPQKLQAACLWRLGFTKAQIARQMNYSRPTALRWVKEFEDALGEEE